MVLFHTHILLGVVVFLFAKEYFTGGNEVIFFLLVLFGSIFPDIDEQNSKINRWSGILGKVIAFFTTHRGIFHSPLLFITLFILLSYLWSSYYAWGLIVGYFTHVLGDGITKMGVQPFYPFSDFKIRGLVKVGGFLEAIIVIVLVVLILKWVL